ncbi:MAG: hypothetical protein NTX61_01630 [Bacteroidetes bacterium]|nr:hypothetical protein [Bacteroidota bacterium]
MFPGSSLFSQVDPLNTPIRLWSEIKKTNNDSLKIEKLFDLAFFYFDLIGDDQLADSVSRLGIQIAEVSHRPELLLISYNRYISSNNLSKYNKNALDCALKAEQVSGTNNPDIALRNTENLVSVYLSGYDYDKALEYSYKSLSISTATENTIWKAQSYLEIGKSLDGKNQKIEAFRNYLTAAALAERIQNSDLLIKCYSELSQFYNMNKLYNKATLYKLMQSDLLKRILPVDSVALMWTKYDLQAIDLNSNNNQMNERIMQEILDFTRRKKHDRMLKYEIALIRSHLIEADKIRQLHDLYYKQFPAELKKLASGNPGLFNRLKAFFCEEENMPDSAIYYFNHAETILQSDPNKILQSNFYNRFGQFLMRHGLKDQAIEKFSKSYELAKAASYFDYMLVASKQLESSYVQNSDYKNAYKYAVLNKVLSDSLNNMSKNDQLLIMEIDHETRLRDQTTELEKQLTLRRHYLQYTAITIIMIGVFIVLLMLGSLKVPEWIIKMLGFFSFIFLFEFIILISDNKINVITHEEPWKIILIKIFLIAILLPMHHWIERRVIAFLLNPRLINISQIPLRSRLRKHLAGLHRK